MKCAVRRPEAVVRYWNKDAAFRRSAWRIPSLGCRFIRLLPFLIRTSFANPSRVPILNDTGKLVLRLTLGILILLHGIFTLLNGIGIGIDPLHGMVTAMGMPGFVA